MFWRRKKLPEDDQPLVPRGLIWQANEDQGSTELPPDMWDNSPNQVKRSPAEPVDMPVRMSGPAQPYSQQQPAAQDPGELSPPLMWPRVDETEIARRAKLVDTAVSFPYRKPVIGAAVPKPLEPASEQKLEEPARLELVSVSPLTPIRAARPKQFNNLLSRFHRLKLPNLFLILPRVGSSRVFARMKEGASSRVRATTQGLNLFRQKSGPAIDRVKLRWMDGSKAALSESRSGIQRVREKIRAIDMSGPGRIWQRARTLRITIRVPASNWRFLTSLRESAKASGVRAQHALRRNSRLWASVGMAGLSALLALGVISALRHYGKDRGLLQPVPATVDAAAPSASSQPVIPRDTTTEKPSPISHHSPKNAHVATKSAPAEVPKRVTASSSKKPRIRRNTDEEDYVAADTYVYYGLGGKPKR